MLGRNKSLMLGALVAMMASSATAMPSPMPAANFTSPGFRRGRNPGKPQPSGSKLEKQYAKNKAKAQRRKNSK